MDKKYYNKFSKEYDTLYMDSIMHFQKNNTSSVKDYTDFYPSFGIKEGETSDFIIYGQAVNGWASEFNLNQKLDNRKLQNSILASNKYLSAQKHSPIDWVNIYWSDSVYKDHSKNKDIELFYSQEVTYRVFHSFFWNIVYKLISDYYHFDRNSMEWSKKLVWSNLYKIAKDGSNPNCMERNIQQEYSTKLLLKEIEEIKPKYCIMLTNYEWWRPFEESIKPRNIALKNNSSVVLKHQKFNNTEIIVTSRPFNANRETFVKEILDVILNQ